MEINGNNPPIVLSNNIHLPDGCSKQPVRTIKDSGDHRSGAFSLELSVQRREIMHVNDLLQSTPDVREAKVEQIQKDIQTGAYNVKAEKIAEKIIQEGLSEEVF